MVFSDEMRDTLLMNERVAQQRECCTTGLYQKQGPFTGWTDTETRYPPYSGLFEKYRYLRQISTVPDIFDTVHVPAFLNI